MLDNTRLYPVGLWLLARRLARGRNSVIIVLLVRRWNSGSVDMDVVVTGARNGLGRYLAERFNALPLTRANAGAMFEGREKYDVVVHCAYSRAKDVCGDALFSYYQDTISLTELAAKKCGRHFIFLSSVSVYPETWAVGREDNPIPADEVKGLYALSKLICESIGSGICPLTTILRPSSLLGAYSPNNVTYRLLRGATKSIPLSRSSLFNYVTYEEVGQVVDAVIRNALNGIYNVASEEPIGIEEVVSIAGHADVSFGSIDYRAPRVSIERAAALVPTLRLPSRAKLLKAKAQIEAGLRSDRSDV